MPFTTEELRTLTLLLYGAGLAAMAWMARFLTSKRKKGERVLLRLIGGMLGASITSFSFGAIVGTWLEWDPVFSLGVAGVVGWIGGDGMAYLAKALEAKLGFKMQGDTHD